MRFLMVPLLVVPICLVLSARAAVLSGTGAGRRVGGARLGRTTGAARR